MIKLCFSELSHNSRLDFEVNDLFLFGCPLGLLLVYRKMVICEEKNCKLHFI